MNKLSKEELKRVKASAKEYSQLNEEANMANDEYELVKSQIDRVMFRNIVSSDTENEVFIKCQPEFFALLQAYMKKYDANKELLDFNESERGKELHSVFEELIEGLDWDEHWNEAYDRQYRTVHRAYNSKGEVIADDRT